MKKTDKRRKWMSKYIQNGREFKGLLMEKSTL